MGAPLAFDDKCNGASTRWGKTKGQVWLKTGNARVFVPVVCLLPKLYQSRPDIISDLDTRPGVAWHGARSDATSQLTAR